MTLAETQRAFGAWLQGGAMPDVAAHAKPGLRVYRNTYRAQLAACLEESFPHTRSWIGAESFRAAIVTHVRRVPPSSWTLDAYARNLPETLAMLYPEDPEIGELAILENALGEVFVAADADPLKSDELAIVDWHKAVLHINPALDLIDAKTNAGAIWHALAQGTEPPPASPLLETATLLVWRQDFVSHFRMIDAPEAQTLRLARAGTPFPELCATLVQVYGEQDGVDRAGRYLGQWLADGLIVKITGEHLCTVS